MEKTSYLQRIREFLHDPEGVVWKDDELLEMIDDSAEQYASDSGIYRSAFYFRVDSNGVAKTPEDYLSFVSGWNEKHLQIDSVSADFLADGYGHYTLLKGSAQYVYEELDSIGKIRFCPNPYLLQDSITVRPEEPFGIFVNASYGIPTGGREYGIPICLYTFNPAGEIQYICTCKTEDVFDYMAVIYYTIYQALTMDSDFKNETLGNTYLKQYQRRVSGARKRSVVIPALRTGGKFY